MICAFLMNPQFTLFRRGRIFYCQDSRTKQQTSLRTADAQQAQILLHSKNEAARQPQLNLQIARVYLTASDPETAKRTWQTVMDEMQIGKAGPTLVRYTRALKVDAFDSIRAVPILETHAASTVSFHRSYHRKRMRKCFISKTPGHAKNYRKVFRAP